MNFLAIGDHHNDIENNLSYMDKVQEVGFDAILYMGDFTDVKQQRGFDQVDIARIIIEGLKVFKKPIFPVPGNNDNWDVVRLLEKEKISVHGKGKVWGDFGVFGFGGAKTPFNTTIEPSDSDLKQGLEKAFSNVKDCKYKIQITHNPPRQTKVDMIRSGVHVGSDVVRSFTEEKNPELVVCGHIHESRGVDMLKKVFLINPGRFPEGYFGLVNFEDGVVTGRVLNLIY